MKKQFLLPFALIFICCCAQKPANLSKAKLATIADCPSDGVCTVELLRNKALEIKVDDLGSNYYQLSESTTTHVVRYKYKRDHDETLQDSGYTEEIIFEISAEKPAMILSGADLHDSKILFGRLCFCRGATGYYKPHDGKLQVSQNKNGFAIDLDLTITEVPQIIKNVQLLIE